MRQKHSAFLNVRRRLSRGFRQIDFDVSPAHEVTIKDERFFSVYLGVDVDKSDTSMKATRFVARQTHLKKPEPLKNFFELFFSDVAVQRFDEQRDFVFDKFNLFFGLHLLLFRLQLHLPLYLVFALEDCSSIPE